MKNFILLLILQFPLISLAQTENLILKHRFEINYQTHYSFRKIWAVNGSPEAMAIREKEDSPVYSQSLGLKYNYSPKKWLLFQFGSATGSKGYGSETFITPVNVFPYPYVSEKTSKYKPLPFIELNYAVGPQISLLKSKLTIFGTIGHSIHFGINRNLDKFGYKGIYSVKSKKGFTYSEVNSEYTSLTPFMTVVNFGINFKIKHYSLGINSVFEWNAKKYTASLGSGYGEVRKRNYIYTYGVCLGYCW
jgi:hypothetical protein